MKANLPGTRFTLEVQPRIPARLARLEALAEDLYYSWDHSVRSLFFRLDQPLWDACGHSPRVFLRRIAQDKLEAAANDRVYMQDYNRVLSSYDTYLADHGTAGIERFLDPAHDLVAYACFEFGMHESFPLYSGGLGVLAGDHCKAASDMTLPFIALGMLYRHGYFRQQIDGEGRQVAHYSFANFADLPIRPAQSAEGTELRVTVPIADRQVQAKIWRAKCGHIDLYLLDTDLPENGENDRRISYQLYGGDETTRIQQEIVLGIGGARAVRALRLEPTVWHINEGHAAFQILERCREKVSAGLDFATALEAVAAATVFTTHTPVPAGHDVFSHALIHLYFEQFVAELGLSMDSFLALGAVPGRPNEFNMTALGLRGSRQRNGVSRIHGGVVSEMERHIWPEIPPAENPIRYVTNGVHVPTFLANEWANLFDMRLGAAWRNEMLNAEFWERIEDIPNHSFWSIKQSLKAKFLEEACERVKVRLRRSGASESQIERATRYLREPEADVLTIGFARRFATYKRATLIFNDPDRLARLVNDPQRPVLIFFAGKAHPKDEPGKELIRHIHDFARQPEFEGRIILLENYDLALARRIVPGVDVWLNNPEYPLEASGTSGQKAGINGVLNLSELDCWCDEGNDGTNGFAVRPYGPQANASVRTREESLDLLDLLEQQIVPLYFERDGNGHANDWVAMAKASMKTLLPRFNAQRMVMDYVREFYAPAATLARRLSADEHAPARVLAAWIARVQALWPQVALRRLDEPRGHVHPDEELHMQVAVRLGELDVNDVVVECIIGSVPFTDSHLLRLEFEFAGKNESGEAVFRLDFRPALPGLQSYQIRIYPYHELLSHRFEVGRMLWL
jgi:starch phosphorylase